VAEPFAHARMISFPIWPPVTIAAGLVRYRYGLPLALILVVTGVILALAGAL
jgi:hypothetical protein